MKILLVQTGFLGDVILSTPVFTEVRTRFPDAEITLLTTPAAAPLVETHAALDRLIVFDKRKGDSGFRGLLRMARHLRAEKFDSVYSLHKSHRTSVLLFLSKIPQRVGFREAALPWLYHERHARKQYAHEVQRNVAILQGLGVNPTDFQGPMSLSFPKETQQDAAKFLVESGHGAPRAKRIALAPGSVWATKRWTPQGFAQVAVHAHLAGAQVYLIGGPDDVAVGEEIISLVTQQSPEAAAQVKNCIGACSLSVSAALIAQMDLVVSNDSAPLHMASAAQVPVVAMFCATVPEFGFGPWQVAHEVLGVDNLECRPCGSHGGQTCPTGTHACQLDLQSSWVVAAAMRLLEAR